MWDVYETKKMYSIQKTKLYTPFPILKNNKLQNFFIGGTLGFLIDTPSLRDEEGVDSSANIPSRDHRHIPPWVPPGVLKKFLLELPLALGTHCRKRICPIRDHRGSNLSVC